MELTTFGAVLRFAIDLEAEGERRYLRAAEAAEGPARDILSTLARTRRKRRQTLERARQENVAEMILEAIRDLDADDYRVAAAPDDAHLRAALPLLSEFEAKSAAFYREAGRKIGLTEVARTFQRLAQENEVQREKLASIG